MEQVEADVHVRTNVLGMNNFIIPDANSLVRYMNDHESRYRFTDIFVIRIVSHYIRKSLPSMYPLSFQCRFRMKGLKISRQKNYSTVEILVENILSFSRLHY